MQMFQAEAAFDGVLLDMPRVSGLCLVATRRALPDVPVLVMSASLSRLQVVKESHLARGYIAKPFGTAQFKQAVRGCFGPAYQPAALSWNRIRQGG
jgi:DNA-binding NarL/FixJ family response regulator